MMIMGLFSSVVGCTILCEYLRTKKTSLDCKTSWKEHLQGLALYNDPPLPPSLVQLTFHLRNSLFFDVGIPNQVLQPSEHYFVPLLCMTSFSSLSSCYHAYVHAE